jgi:integrase
VRRYDKERKTYTAENLRASDNSIVLADDYADADGVRVLTFAQAQQKARGTPTAKTGPTTVSEVMDGYLKYLETKGRPQSAINDVRWRIDAFIRPELGKIKLSALTSERLSDWLSAIASAPPRLRTSNGEKQRFRAIADEDDARRARRATANRIWTVLRAALNQAFRAGKIETDIVWRRVEAFESVNAARPRYLSVAEARRLINACDPDFRPLAQAALETGARYSELGRLKVRDFNSDAGTVAIWQSKSGKARTFTSPIPAGHYFNR